MDCLAYLSYVGCKPLNVDVHVVLGSTFATLWNYHWRCVSDGELWSSHAAINMFKQDHSSLFSSKLVAKRVKIFILNYYQ
jgi:hypothetical protein